MLHASAKASAPMLQEVQSTNLLAPYRFVQRMNAHPAHARSSSSFEHMLKSALTRQA